MNLVNNKCRLCLYSDQLPLHFSFKFMGNNAPPPAPLPNTLSTTNLRFLKDQQKCIEEYGAKVIEIANLAQAIYNNQQSINIEIQLSCLNLPKMDRFGLCDPLIIVLRRGEEEDYYQIGRTQVIPNELNPVFSKTFIIPFTASLDKIQFYQFLIYDVDDFTHSQDVSPQNLELIGLVDTTDQEIWNNRPISLEINTKETSKTKSVLKISASEYQTSNCKVRLHLSGRQFVSKHSLFVKVEVQSQRDWNCIATSNIIQNFSDHEIDWAPIEIQMNKFPTEQSTNLRIRAYEYNKTKGISDIGSTEQNLLMYMINHKGQISLKIVKGGLLVGVVVVKSAIKNQDKCSFLSYMYTGSQLNLIIAIDFSNFNRQFHTMDWDNNIFIKVLEKIVGLLQYFDRRGAILCYGFGASLPPRHIQVSQLFALNGNIFKPFISQGIDQIISNYKQTLKRVRLHGPAVMSEVIELAIQNAKANLQAFQETRSQLQYTTLVIITGGKVSDLDATRDAVIRASDFPISLVMIGVGQQPSEHLSYLDSDCTMLHSERLNRSGSRDIVQFIHYRNFYGEKAQVLPYEILHEIPSQHQQYMESIKFYPPSNARKRKDQYFNEKVDLHKRATQHLNIPEFLAERRKLFLEKAVRLTRSPQLVNQIIQDGIMAESLELIIQLVGHRKHFAKKPKKQPRVSRISSRQLQFQHKNFLIQSETVGHRVFKIKEENRLDQIIKEKKLERYQQTISLLHKIQNSQPDWSKVYLEHSQIQPQNLFKLDLSQYLADKAMCLCCRKRRVEVKFLPCGHEVCCSGDADLARCPFCRSQIIMKKLLKQQAHRVRDQSSPC